MRVLRSMRRRRRPRLLALLPVRDEMRYLPDYFENAAPHVDGVVVLDDGSSDGSDEYAASRPEVLEVIRLPRRTPHDWDDARNHRLLIEAARRHRPDWLLGLDADERLERDFRARAEAVIERADVSDISAYSLRLREVWGSPTTIRVDGIWGKKRTARLFRSMEDHVFDDRTLHPHWAPLNARRPNGSFPRANLIIYHLRMLHLEDRIARRDRYKALDPDRRFQPIGYDYLTDETGIELKEIPKKRGYRPLGR